MEKTKKIDFTKDEIVKSKRGRKAKITQKDKQLVLELLKSCNGNKMKVAEMLNVDRSTISKYVKKNKDLQQAYSDFEEGRIDNVEEVLYRKSLAGDNTCIKTFLNAKARDRGYISDNQVNNYNLNNQGVQLTIDDQKKLIDEIKTIEI